MPISRVSRTIARLEECVGTSLILRTTRSFQVTDAGRRLHQESRHLMHRLSEVQELFASTSEAISGRVRITTPEDIGGIIVAPLLAELNALYPALELELVCTDEMLDLVKAGVDIGLRAGQLRDSSLKAKRLGIVHFICVATRGYLDRVGSPLEPKDLIKHACIHLVLGPSDVRQDWTLTKGKTSLSIKVAPHLTANHTGAVIALAKAHRGIALVPAPIVAEDLRRGSLQRVLPEWSVNPVPAHLVYPPQRVVARRVRVVAEFLEERLQAYFA